MIWAPPHPLSTHHWSANSQLFHGLCSVLQKLGPVFWGSPLGKGTGPGSGAPIDGDNARIGSQLYLDLRRKVLQPLTACPPRASWTKLRAAFIPCTW